MVKVVFYFPAIRLANDWRIYLFLAFRAFTMNNVRPVLAATECKWEAEVWEAGGWLARRWRLAGKTTGGQG